MLSRSLQVTREFPERLREEVRNRADFRCEYCLYPERWAAIPHQVDHIISRKHGGRSTLENAAYCCVFCNRHKGSDIASIDVRTGQSVRLFTPRSDHGADHFRLRGAVIEPLTPVAEVTARLLRFNQAERVTERAILQKLGRYPR